jgi:hypothetical protein
MRLDEAGIADDKIDVITNELILNHLLLRFDDMVALKKQVLEGDVFLTW